MSVSSGEWDKFLEASPEWKLLVQALLEQVENWRTDLENGNAVDRDNKPITDEFIRGQLSGLRFCLALPELLKDETKQLEQLSNNMTKENEDGGHTSNTD
jgi:hypothetical protein